MLLMKSAPSHGAGELLKGPEADAVGGSALDRGRDATAPEPLPDPLASRNLDLWFAPSSMALCNTFWLWWAKWECPCAAMSQP